jgi:hypothetical protein
VHRNILLPVSSLTIDDECIFESVLPYLHGTQELGITLHADKQAKFEHTSMYLMVYMASYGKCHSGLCITLGAGLVDTKSTKQRIFTKSSTEVIEYIPSDFDDVIKYDFHSLLNIFLLMIR